MTTGEKIAALRREKGLSQEALGEKLGLTRQAVSKWEADQAVPTMDNLVELSRLFGVPVDTLLRPDEPLPDKEQQPPEGVKLSAEGLKISYAPVLTRKTKWFVIGVAVLLFVSVVGNMISIMQKQNYELEVLHLQTQVQELRAQVEYMQANPNTVYLPTEGETETQGDLTDWQLDYRLDQNNPEQIVVTMSALPREVNEQEIPKFVIRSGTESWSGETWLDGVYSGQITIPLCDTFSAYLVLTAPDGSVRNLLISAETNVKDRFTPLVTAGWIEGGINSAWGKTSAAGRIEIVVDLLGRDVWPVSGRVLLLQDGKQVAEQPIDALLDSPIEPGTDSVVYHVAVNWQAYNLEVGKLTVEVELTDNVGRVETYPVD